MKIAIKSDTKKLTIRIPSFLLFNPITATLCGSRIIRSIMKDDENENDIRITAKDARKLFRVINRARRKHKDWYIVDVADEDGESVKIKL